ncbi:MAG: hypothetical protein QNJ97_21555 [Myxococcota bacterium]|nr:hypothetical protein [Myxococcota bacterium]
MPSYKKIDKGDNGQELVEKFAHDALEAFRADLPDAYGELVKTYNGQAVSAGVFGMGMVVVDVRDGKVRINPRPSKKNAPIVGRGATYPETIAALATGKLTVLDAYHKGDLAVQARKSQSLHDGYNEMTKYADGALKSKRLQKVFAEFCKAADIDV